MPQAPTKKPAAPGSIAPQGPTNPAAKVYPALSGKTSTNAPTSKTDEWRGGAIATPNAAVATKGAVPVKVAKNLPGNQVTKNAHTKPSAIKPNGTPAQTRKLQSATSSKHLAAKSLYPHLNN